MDPHAGKLVLNGATSQLDRRLRALDPGYAPVDGRSFSDLLDFAVQLGRLIKFYDLDNEPGGDWVEFFLTDPTVLLAAVASVDPAAAESAYTREQKETARAHGFEHKFRLLRETFAAVLDLARQINLWLEVLQRDPEDDATRMLRQQIDEAVRGDLGAQLRRLRSYDEGAGLPDALGEPIGLDYSGFLPVWEIRRVCPDGAIYRGASRSRKIDHALPFLDPIFYAFLDAVQSFRAFALANVPATLGGGNHNPQSALYIAFVRLFAHAQETLNTLSARYARLYDRDVLREGNAAGLPDSLYLTFTLAEGEGVASAAVPRGTLFPAGQDAADQTILYAADRGLTVTAARIAKLLTLRVLPGAGGQPSRVLASEIAVDPQTGDQAGGTGASWGTFGETQEIDSGAEVTVPATLGFALASAELLLTGGEREVEADLRIAFQGKASAADVLRLVLTERLRLYASTTAGWFRVLDHEVSLDGGPASPPEPSRAVLCFTLPPAAPPLVASTASEEEANPAPGLPTLKAYLDQQPLEVPGGTVDPLAVLSGIEILGCEIHVRVRGLADLRLENTDGEIDPSAPFPVFGASPAIGSFLQARSEELFSKTPESLSVAVDWLGLPRNDTGFAGYYRDYTIGLDGRPAKDRLFDNQTFLGAFSVRDPGTWGVTEASPASPPEEVFLFRTRDGCGDPVPEKEGPLCTASLFDTLEVQPLDGPPPYYSPAASALRLTLTAPPYGFGNDLYAQNVLSAVIADLPDTQGCQQTCLTACRPLDTAARSVAACLRRCQAVSPPDQDLCLAGGLTLCAEALVQAAVDALWQCLAEAGGLSEGDVQQIRGEVETCRSLPGAQQAECLRCCIAGLLAGTGSPPAACLDACLRKCLLFLDNAIRLFACLDGSPPPAGLEECARVCQEALQASYAACLEDCMGACMSPKKELKYPNEPYLPMASSVRVDYTARTDQPAFFHLLPFGGTEQPAAFGTGETPLLPRWNDPGNLYLGFSALAAAQALTLLVRMTSGDPAADPPPVLWSYLTGNRWTPLTAAEILADGTGGLQHSGLLALDLPAFPPGAPSTVLPGGFQWLRASVARAPGRFPRTLAITPHALTATWQAGSGDGEHLRQPLPAGTITASVQDLPMIATIAQPLPSFGGRPPETDGAFRVRLAERLRHKDRAVLAWDDERLVLERFPTVWKTQALPARDLTGGGVPGSVLVVIVPGPESEQELDPAVPRAPADQLDRIKTYLESLASPFVRFQVVNPVYVRITVSATVQFTQDSDPGTNVKRLNNDLVSYLSPWYYDAERASKGGRYVSEDAISEFIQTRPYVDALDCVDFAYDPDPAALEWYFLTSAAVHEIKARSTR